MDVGVATLTEGARVGAAGTPRTAAIQAPTASGTPTMSAQTPATGAPLRNRRVSIGMRMTAAGERVKPVRAKFSAGIPRHS